MSPGTLVAWTGRRLEIFDRRSRARMESSDPRLLGLLAEFASPRPLEQVTADYHAEARINVLSLIEHLREHGFLVDAHDAHERSTDAWRSAASLIAAAAIDWLEARLVVPADASGKIVDAAGSLLRACMRWARSPLLTRLLVNGVVLPAQRSHRARDFVTTLRDGSRIAGNSRDLIPLLLLFTGYVEPDVSAYVARTLGPGDTFVDVGAHIGYFTLLASRLVTATGRVAAIEASPRTFAMLSHNLALNPHCANVRAVLAAAGDAVDDTAIYRGPDDATGISSVLPRAHTRFEAMVRGAPLGDLLRPDECARARLIKIDTEGAEFQVVAGLLPLLPTMRGDVEVVVETSPDWTCEGRPATTNDMIRMFASAGFNAYILRKGFCIDRPHVPTRVQAAIPGHYDIVFSRRDLDIL